MIPLTFRQTLDSEKERYQTGKWYLNLKQKTPNGKISPFVSTCMMPFTPHRPLAHWKDDIKARILCLRITLNTIISQSKCPIPNTASMRYCKVESGQLDLCLSATFHPRRKKMSKQGTSQKHCGGKISESSGSTLDGSK